MKSYTSVIAILAVCALPALAAAQSAPTEAATAPNDVRRDGGDLRLNGNHNRQDRDRQDMGARAELNRNPYAGRSMRHSHAERIVIIRHHHHHQHHDM